ncbi:hypothetical protein HDU93_005813, partial [Gonapodya sp. JEL0774]
MLVVARTLQGIAAAAVWTLGLALVGDVFPADQLGKAYGIAMAGFSVGTVIGLPIGGTLYAAAGYWSPFLVSSSFILLDMLGRLLVVEPKRPSLQVSDGSSPLKSDIILLPAEETPSTNPETSTTGATSPISAIASPSAVNRGFPHNITWHVLHTSDPTYWDILRDPAILTLCGVNAVGAVVVFSPEPTLPLYLEKELGANSVSVSLIYFAMVVTGLISGPLAGILRDKYGSWRVVIPSLVCTCIVTPFWAFAKTYASFAAVTAIFGFFMTAVQAPM